MDEKTDVPSEEQLPIRDAVDLNAENATEVDADILPTDSTATESLISTSTDTIVSTDTLTATLTSAETIPKSPTEISASQTSTTNVLTPADTFISSDALSVADALTSVDDLQSAEELTSASLKASADATAIANKVSSVDAVESSPVVCQLEEELKRLHEGDPLEDSKPLESLLTVKEPAIVKTVPDKKALATAEPLIEPVISKTETVANKKPVAKQTVEESMIQDLDPLEMLASEEVSKNPVLIKNAQEELKKIDVLVCGSCHEVFHFVEGFQAHKSDKCTGRSSLTPICEGEAKPQVWGFTLWKNRQNKLIKEGESVPSSWVIYQKWCKLPQSDKDAWIIAGQTLQFCSKIGTAKVAEFKSRPQLKQVEKVERDPLALDGFAESNKENSILAIASPDNKTTATDVIKKTIIKPVRLNNDVTILPSTKNGNDNSNKALRTIRSTEKREYVVERIVAKRFNPKRKTWEYQIKWENFSSDENTWEPISNLNHCKQMVEEFEEQLKRLKAEKAKQQAAGVLPKGRGRPIKPSQSISTPSSSFSSDSTTTPGRPQRTSKQKALNQVKAWCGNISDADEGSTKRSFDDVDSDDSFEKKMKYEDYSDDSDVEIKPKIPLKRIAPKPPTVQVIKNGVGRVHPLPQNVLIPDANGVVRINQKQLPSLSTGVYIMSKTAGIIKLDSTTSKVATSGGQTIVKVAPKIGQTQIKIVKKDGATTTTKQIIQMTPNKPTNVPPKIYKPVITKVRKPPEILPKPAAARITVKPKEEIKKPEPPPPPPVDDESDDGLEELPFPDDMPLPEPDSPPRDFVLDPFTGKIAGQEYPDPEPEVVIKPDIEDTSLENIVKLAAAEITEDDLKSESVETPMETDDIDTQEDEESLTPKKTDSNSSATSSPTTTPVKVSMASTLVRNEPSILNKALNSSAILRKSLMHTSPQPKVQQRILNRSFSHSRSHNVSSVVRSVSRSSHSPSLVRTRLMAPKPRFNIASPSNIIKSQHDVSPRNVYSKSHMPVTRKIGNTTIRSTNMGMAGQRQPARIVQTSTNVHKVSPRKESLLIRQVTEKSIAPTKPKTVISMPSLIGDDDASLSPVPEIPKSPVVPITTNVTVMETETGIAEPVASVEAAPLESADANSLTTDISSFTLADNENPIFITGDDGTVYQVAGQNEHGQTILLTQGTDGQQQCLLVTNEVAEAMETSPEEAQAEISIPEISASVTEPLSVKTESDSSDQVVAQVVRAEPPSPGGTHKVVVMLPDGNLMVTQVSPEEYASLELE